MVFLKKRLLKKVLYLNIFFFLIGCSFGAGKWDNVEEDIKIAKQRENAKIIFSTKKKFDLEINAEAKINVKKSLLNKNWQEQNFSSNNVIPHLEYNNKNELTFKSNKIGKNKFNIKNLDFEPILEKNTIFLYDPNGTIFSYGLKKKKINWKYNFYKKRFRNSPKDLNISIKNDNLIVSDNFGYIYNLNKNNGKIKWAKNYNVPFKSNIKIDNDNIFLLNQDNKFYIISAKTGKQILDLETFPSLLKTNTKTNVSLDKIKKNVYFVTSSSEIYSLNYKNRNINWLFSLTMGNTDQQVDLFFSSPIVYKQNQIILSSAISTFSMNSNDGRLNWEIPVVSNILPIIIGDNICLSSKDGFILNIEQKTGKVIWSKKIFTKLKKLNYKKTGDITSTLFLSNRLFLTTENGYFIFLNFKTGEILSYTKVAKSFLTKPIVKDGQIFIIDSKMRILQFN
tara:strand:+ start:688 stop:2040 length:1353 start_codon:yes stop_codon:yes gene_type:complete